MSDESEMEDLAFSEVEAMASERVYAICHWYAMGERLYSACRWYCLLFERNLLEEGDLDSLGTAAAKVAEVAAFYIEIRCIDCSEESDFYMVLDDVWAAAGLKPGDGWVCTPCLSVRLKRPLEREDFREDFKHVFDDLPGKNKP